MLEIEIFSDAICPWCYIGKRRLEAAMGGGPNGNGLDPDIQLRWRPYLLYPRMPLEGLDRGELLRRRYGPRGDKARVPASILAEAESEGISLRYDLIERTPNTRAAHRLLEWVYLQKGWQVQHQLVETLFQAYFSRGLDLGDLGVLEAMAESHGLSGPDCRSVLTASGALGKSLDQALNEQLDRSLELGVSGVPGYVMGSGYLLPGAQSVETMQAIIARAKTKFSTP